MNVARKPLRDKGDGNNLTNIMPTSVLILVGLKCPCHVIPRHPLSRFTFHDGVRFLLHACFKEITSAVVNHLEKFGWVKFHNLDHHNVQQVVWIESDKLCSLKVASCVEEK